MSAPKVSDALQKVIHAAFALAVSYRHEYVSVEHLLYCLLEDGACGAILETCGVDADTLRDALRRFFETKLTTRENVSPKQTVSCQRAVERAARHILSCGKNTIETHDLLVAIFDEEHSHAAFFLRKAGLDRLELLREVSHGVAAMGPFENDRETEGAPDDDDTAPPASGGVGEKRKKASSLEEYAVNLTLLAREGKIDTLVGRGPETRAMMRTLCRRKKNNPLLVGEPGVGKTAIVEGLALKVVRGEVPEPLKNLEIFALDMGALLAGTRYRGDFEERLKNVLKEISARPDAVLFIDEIHTVVGAGAVQGGAMDASNILKPMLANGKLRCIGSCVYEEYRNYVSKDKAFSRRFQKIDVTEPTVDETIAILVGLAPFYQEHYHIRYTRKALEAAARLSAKYIQDRFLPDKAIDTIDEAGARNSLSVAGKRKRVIGVGDIETVVAEIARVPSVTVTASAAEQLRNLDEVLKSVLFGQDEAVDTVVKAIKMSRAGLSDHKNKPVGAYLFTGPTGVGKTELTRQLALKLGARFARYDMSEYSEKHSVARLIGSPPGYVGFERGGLMTEEISRHPHAVLLLDEIEKADPDIYNILLQIMDYGTLTDNNGKKVDFRDVILIMTSNVGAKDLFADRVGFEVRTEAVDTGKAVEKHFNPEFINRLDAVVKFKPLTPALMERVADKFVRELAESLRRKNIEVELTDAGRKWLAEKGYDPKMGARPMDRLIKREIGEKIADEILFGRLIDGGKLVIDANKGELKLKY